MNARHEYKHSLNYMDYQILRGRLEHLLARDENVDARGEYRVRSLYFDSPRDKALREKIDGVDRREKFRIRRYNDDVNYLRLEKKSKAQGLSYKQSVSLEKAQVADLLAGETDWMVADGRDLVMELYAKMKGEQLRPRTIVDYIREPFVYPAGNVRITLDREIRTGLKSTDFFSENLTTIPAGDHFVILEVKYDAFIPDFIAKIIQIQNRRAAACSKYALCRIYG